LKDEKRDKNRPQHITNSVNDNNNIASCSVNHPGASDDDNRDQRRIRNATTQHSTTHQYTIKNCAYAIIKLNMTIKHMFPNTYCNVAKS